MDADRVVVFREANDPTFALLPILWHPLYSWDEALENLYGHICYLVSQTHSLRNPHSYNNVTPGSDRYPDSRYDIEHGTAHHTGPSPGKYSVLVPYSQLIHFILQHHETLLVSIPGHSYEVVTLTHDFNRSTLKMQSSSF